MNKSLKKKNSTPIIKPNKSKTSKQLEMLSARTPRNNIQKCDEKKKKKFEKAKSIPAMTYQDLQSKSMHSQNFFNSIIKPNIETMLTNQPSEQKFLYSLEDRNTQSGSKMSFRSKMEKSSKSQSQRTMFSSKNRETCDLRQSAKNEKMRMLFERTKNVLQSYRQNEQNWKKQKGCLLKQLEKYKQKQRKRKGSNSFGHRKN